jgi:uncharacterized protein (TIGR02246 family)
MANSGKSKESDVQAIRKLDAEWAKAARDKDFARVLSFYATDGSVVWPTGPAAKGHAAIRAEWEKAYKDLDDPYLDFKPTHIEVSSGGDMAVDFGVVYFAANPKPDDLENIAKYLVVWKREHGNWKVLYDCWNRNAPPEPTEARV